LLPPFSSIFHDGMYVVLFFCHVAPPFPPFAVPLPLFLSSICTRNPPGPTLHPPPRHTFQVSPPTPPEPVCLPLPFPLIPLCPFFLRTTRLRPFRKIPPPCLPPFLFFPKGVGFCGVLMFPFFCPLIFLHCPSAFFFSIFGSRTPHCGQITNPATFPLPDPAYGERAFSAILPHGSPRWPFFDFPPRVAA